jgi:hypothetical protein
MLAQRGRRGRGATDGVIAFLNLAPQFTATRDTLPSSSLGGNHDPSFETQKAQSFQDASSLLTQLRYSI